MANDDLATGHELKRIRLPRFAAGMGSPDPADELEKDTCDGVDEEAKPTNNSAAADTDTDESVAAPHPSIPGARLVLMVGLLAAGLLIVLGSWFGYSAYQGKRTEAERDLFLQAGRQGALNLTTIDYERVEADIQEILDSATGAFYDEFNNRSQPFMDVVKKAESKSVGTITEAGLESFSDNEAQVLVAVNVNTTNLGVEEQVPRAWRMRISVEKVDGQEKISKVSFVP
ncbi:hypothetical protein [Mycobacterium sp. 1274756.6]|uniref:hypothetical protein n=1 Tax=Mycobacterium sp. 1274756.6 TaxID=1834076 RepID=UPI0007FCA5D0|nr:hypothetical protein [Mycobacterium sp. 1274756.6]OBJ70683.1 hypothetical protein A5643_09900 [Mycobacterium sp. 1274756.6]